MFTESSAQNRNSRSQNLYRTLLFWGGVVYLIWWALIELLFPQAYNPLGSRLTVSLLIWSVFIASFFSIRVLKYIESWAIVSFSVLTIHYFYLFHKNETDINWVVGSYITVIAVSACIQTSRALLYYSVLVLALSVGLVIADRSLLQTVFLPGMITILVFVYLGVRAKLETTRWFLDLFDSVFEGIVVHQNGVVIDSNEAFAHIFGYQRHEVIGMKIVQFVIPEAREMVAGKIEVMDEAPYEVTGVRKDGAIISLEIRGKKHFVRGKLYRLSAVVDITARKQRERDRVLYEASLESIRMRDEFLSIASHELKTPVTTIKLQTQVARLKVARDSMNADPESIMALIDQTDRQADRLTRLIEEMLDVSQISTGRMRLERREFDLSDLVQEVVHLLSTPLKQSGSEILIDAPAAATLYADRFRIEQVVVNLISNAIKYGRGKPITVAIRADATEVRLKVSDQGIGIAKNDHERIFERFERAVSAKKISGLGLGLFICKYIVDLHEGRIEVESEVEKGSVFTVVLPRRVV